MATSTLSKLSEATTRQLPSRPPTIPERRATHVHPSIRNIRHAGPLINLRHTGSGETTRVIRTPSQRVASHVGRAAVVSSDRSPRHVRHDVSDELVGMQAPRQVESHKFVGGQIFNLSIHEPLLTEVEVAERTGLSDLGAMIGRVRRAGPDTPTLYIFDNGVKCKNEEYRPRYRVLTRGQLKEAIDMAKRGLPEKECYAYALELGLGKDKEGETHDRRRMPAGGPKTKDPLNAEAVYLSVGPNGSFGVADLREHPDTFVEYNARMIPGTDPWVNQPYFSSEWDHNKYGITEKATLGDAAPVPVSVRGPVVIPDPRVYP